MENETTMNTVATGAQALCKMLEMDARAVVDAEGPGVSDDYFSAWDAFPSGTPHNKGIRFDSILLFNHLFALFPENLRNWLLQQPNTTILADGWTKFDAPAKLPLTYRVSLRGNFMLTRKRHEPVYDIAIANEDDLSPEARSHWCEISAGSVYQVVYYLLSQAHARAADEDDYGHPCEMTLFCVGSRSEITFRYMLMNVQSITVV